MVQQIIIAVIFLAAMAYIAWIVYRNLSAKSACESGCGKCDAVDFNKIEQQIKAKEQGIN